LTDNRKICIIRQSFRGFFHGTAQLQGRPFSGRHRQSSQWAETFPAADIADGAAAGEALLARALPADFELHVLEPYLFEVLQDGAHFKPASVREIIRAAGPTVRLDLGKQADAKQES
jgi:hypothetical protein